MQHNSKKRQAILQCLCSTDIHPTAVWIHEKLHPEYPELSLGTVYRNLGQLKDGGLIRSMGVVAGQEHFDGIALPHPHVICKVCGTIRNLEMKPEYQHLMADVQKDSAISIDEIQLLGVCSKCSSQPDPEAEKQS